MSLVNAVKFRSSISQLTPTDCHQFLNDHIVIKALFVSISQSDEVADTINKSISRIINSRQNIETITININDFEQALTTTKNSALILSQMK